MRLIQNLAGALAVTLAAGELRAQTSPPAAATTFNLTADQPGKLSFIGSGTPELFAREVNESFQGVLKYNYFSRQDGAFPPGFVQASPTGQPWHGTMWSRDAGAFLRELVFWGYYAHASQMAQCLMDFTKTNQAGFISIPRYFAPKHGRESGTELDGHSAIIIGLAALWQRLPPEDPFRLRLYAFLHQPSSPVRYLHHELEHHPLIAGTGEFGEGGPKGLCDNVVQNNLSALALLSAANMEDAAGDHTTAQLWRADAQILFHNIEKYLVDSDGAWIWCIDPTTLKPDPAVVLRPVNIGFGGFNGVFCMSADVLGLDSSDWPWPGAVEHGEKTFAKLLAFPSRREQFEKYGIWPQFNVIHAGLLTGPSYGQGYALQTMLLSDKLAMAGHGLDFLAQTTFTSPGIDFGNGRLSPYYFYERMYSPDAVGKTELAVGCGPLNLVNVAEPLKIARLILGVDDTSLNEVRIIPRLPPGWSGFRAENWPIRTRQGMVRADLSFDRTNGVATIHLQVASGQTIPSLAVRLPAENQPVWKHQTNVKEIRLESTTP